MISKVKEENRVVSDQTWITILKDYTKYLHIYRGLAEETIVNQKIYLDRFREWHLNRFSFFDFTRIERGTLEEYMRGYHSSHGVGSLKWMQFSLRSFLRYCHLERYLPHDFSMSVPTVRKPRLANIPKGITPDQITDLFKSVDRSTSLGKRDYAILQLLATYGVRGIQVRKLTLKDIKWRENRIEFKACKGGYNLNHPLMPNVGNSLIDYLQNARPLESIYNEVFLTMTRTHKPIGLSGSLSGIIRRHLEKAKIRVPIGASQGSHLFRHSLAQRLLDNGATFKNIADMLGHRDISTTLIYTKIDLNRLKEAALNWPEVAS